MYGEAQRAGYAYRTSSRCMTDTPSVDPFTLLYGMVPPPQQTAYRQYSS